MPQISSTVLQGLAQPSFGRGMFELGSALGGIPGQRREKQKQEKFNEIMKRGQAAMSSAEPDPVVLSGIAQELSALGYTKEAQQFATKASERSKQVEQAGMFTGKVPGTPEYNEALAKSQMAQGKFAEAGATAAANVKAREEKERKARLMGEALQKAVRSKDPAGNSARVRNMTTEQLMEYLKPKEKKPGVQLVAGARYIDPDTGKVLVEARDAPAKQVNIAYDLLKSGKYDPTSFKYDNDGNLLGDIRSVKLVTDDKERGSIPANVEKQIIAMDVASGKSVVGFGRARQLKDELIASPEKSAGIISTLRTDVLTFAGLRDAEEERKTDFLRTRNTEIVNGLPPGVASDTDIRIFSQGFPKADASSQEIIRYLEAEEKILAAQSDMSALFQQHVNKQVEDGIEATTAGFEFERRKYANVMTTFRDTVENAIDQQGNPLYSEEDKKRFLREALGFVPTYYSR